MTLATPVELLPRLRDWPERLDALLRARADWPYGNSIVACCPTASARASYSNTCAITQTRDRSAIVSRVVDGSTDVPTVIPRFTTTPLLGATTVTRPSGLEKSRIVVGAMDMR